MRIRSWRFRSKLSTVESLFSAKPDWIASAKSLLQRHATWRLARNVLLAVFCFVGVFQFDYAPIVVKEADAAHAPPVNCAILLFGLPRQFRAAVLPGIVEHVLPHNTACDVFIHYYNQSSEDHTRGADAGRSGIWDPHDVHLLGEYIPKGKLFVAMEESEDTFFQRYQPLLDKIWAPGSLYQTSSESIAFSNASLTNVIKMWHSQRAVFQLMEAQEHSMHYSSIAMLRNDVLFVRPVPDFSRPQTVATVPGFGKYPVSDRFFYGPYDAAKIWADKFQRLDQHIRHNSRDGLHSEKMLRSTIFPAIRHAGVDIVEDKTHQCCIRVRADTSMRLQDCGRECGHDPRNAAYVAALLQRPCHMNFSNPAVVLLECGDAAARTEADPPLLALADTPGWQNCPWHD